MPDGTDVLLVDDHPLLAIALQAELSKRGFNAELGDITSVEALLAQVQRLEPTLTVMDVSMPAIGDGVSLIAHVRAAGSRVIMLTGSFDACLWGECIEAGASAVVGKDEPLADIFGAIEAAVAGRPLRVNRNQVLLEAFTSTRRQRTMSLAPFELLTPSERRVLAGLMDGRTVSDIAATDYVGVETVRSHVKAVLRKLVVGSQLEAVALAYRTGWRELRSVAAN